MHRIIIRNKKQLPKAAIEIIEYVSNRRIIAFYGTLGAGKTTIINAICKVLGVENTTASPSFTLVNEYMTRAGEMIYHIDLYRINNLEEAFDFGIEEYLLGNSYCFVEWPERIEDILPDDTVRIRISVTVDEQRILDFF